MGSRGISKFISLYAYDSSIKINYEVIRVKIIDRVNILKEEMKKRNIDAYIIPSSDAHLSEYVAEHWKSRAWISGFTGSAGTVVITQGQCGLWTDGRYFIQAEKQLEGSSIALFKMREPGVPTLNEWLKETLPQGATIGFDGTVFAQSSVKAMEGELKIKSFKFNSEYDLIDLIWKDRPAMPMTETFNHDVKYAGKSTKEKLQEVRAKMSKKDVDTYVISKLDDIAWLCNIRANDVNCTPVSIAFMIVTNDGATLFIEPSKVPQEVVCALKENGVELKGYEDIYEAVKALNENRKIYYSADYTNRKLYESMPKACEKVNGRDITTDLKALKNDTEVECLRKSHLRDCVALAKFACWLQENVGKEEITEMSADDKLIEFRAQQDLFKGPSFGAIVGYKEHAAMMHYSATPENQYSVDKEGMLLIDSGGQYLDGTTDITRTFVLGELTEEQKRDFTLVAKGVINLSMSKFLYGITGTNLDVLSRQPLWEYGIDYKCGTGHGVGFMLSVHEGPQRIAPQYNDAILEKGMVITVEPGVYKEGRHGIRLENTVIVTEDEKTEFGQFMKFEVLNPFPLDLNGIVPEMLNEKEKAYLNGYHKWTYESLSPYLNDNEKEWLKNTTRAI